MCRLLVGLPAGPSQDSDSDSLASDEPCRVSSRNSSSVSRLELRLSLRSAENPAIEQTDNQKKWHVPSGARAARAALETPKKKKVSGNNENLRWALGEIPGGRPTMASQAAIKPCRAGKNIGHRRFFLKIRLRDGQLGEQQRNPKGSPLGFRERKGIALSSVDAGNGPAGQLSPRLLRQVPGRRHGGTRRQRPPVASPAARRDLPQLARRAGQDGLPAGATRHAKIIVFSPSAPSSLNPEP